MEEVSIGRFELVPPAPIVPEDTRLLEAQYQPLEDFHLLYFPVGDELPPDIAREVQNYNRSDTVVRAMMPDSIGRFEDLARLVEFAQDPLHTRDVYVLLDTTLLYDPATGERNPANVVAGFGWLRPIILPEGPTASYCDVDLAAALDGIGVENPERYITGAVQIYDGYREKLHASELIKPVLLHNAERHSGVEGVCVRTSNRRMVDNLVHHLGFEQVGETDSSAAGIFALHY